MAATIRLQRHGKKKSPIYRIVATNHQNKRDGKYIELLGTFDPTVEPPTVVIKEDRIKYWVSVGAIVKGIVRKVIKDNISGIIEAKETNVRNKIIAARKKRKARLGAKPGAKSAKKKADKK